MAKNKHIDKICIFATITALVLTILFMNGEILGLQTIVAEESEIGEFTENDLNADWSISSATVITLTGDSGSVSGNGAYIYEGDVYIVYAGKYIISGELNDGTVIIDADGDDKIWIQLNDANLNCSDGPAIAVENADKVFLTLAEETENTITSGETFSDEAVENGYDGAIYSRDDLTINGNGNLTVTGNYAHGIVANDDLVITGGTINIEAAEDAIHANDSVRIANAEITINAGDDGITTSNDDGSDYFYIESGSVLIESCYEGIEAANVLITGGETTIYPSDDGINATSTEGSVDVSGGQLTIINNDGRDADGIDSNGSINISGGRVFVSVPTDSASTALDYGSENRGELLIDGGIVIAAGGSGMLEEISEESSQGFVVYTGDDGDAGTAFTLSDADGTELLSDTIPVGFSALILSTPEMINGESYILTIGDEETTLTAGENSGSFGSGGMGGHGNPGGAGNNDGPGKMDESSESGNAMSSEMPGNFGGPETDGEMPEMNGEMPEANEAMPEANGDMKQMSEQENEGNHPGMNGDKSEDREGNRGGGSPDGQTMPGMENQQEETTEEITVTTETWILLGSSILILLIGLEIAFRAKGK